MRTPRCIFQLNLPVRWNFRATLPPPLERGCAETKLGSIWPLVALKVSVLPGAERLAVRGIPGPPAELKVGAWVTPVVLGAAALLAYGGWFGSWITTLQDHSFRA